MKNAGNKDLFLMLGDCLERMKEIPNSYIDMVLCDLPYGTTACKWDTVIPFEPLWAEYFRVCKPNAAIVLFAAQPFTSRLVCSNIKNFKYDWTWKKETGTGHLNAKKMPMKDKEDILVFYREQPIYNPQFSSGSAYTASSKGAFRGAQKTSEVYGFSDETARGDNEGKRYPKQVLEFSRANDRGLHPTQKPVALLEYLIYTYTKIGQIVLDNTMGSGSTGVACKNTKRGFIGIEMDENLFELCQKRILS